MLGFNIDGEVPFFMQTTPITAILRSIEKTILKTKEMRMA